MRSPSLMPACSVSALTLQGLHAGSLHPPTRTATRRASKQPPDSLPSLPPIPRVAGAAAPPPAPPAHRHRSRILTGPGRVRVHRDHLLQLCVQGGCWRRGRWHGTHCWRRDEAWGGLGLGLGLGLGGGAGVTTASPRGWEFGAPRFPCFALSSWALAWVGAGMDA